MLGCRVHDRGQRLLDTDVDDVEAIVGQDDVDQVLADVVHVTTDGRKHDAALPRLGGPVHVRFEVTDGKLHDLRGGQHERQLHLAGAEQVTDRLHAVKQHVVDDLQGRALAQGLVQVGFQADPLPVDDPALEPFPERQPGELGCPAGLQLGRVHALEQLEQPGQRVVARAPAVIDQVQGDLKLFAADPRDRHDPGRVDDRRVQPGTDALVEEDRVEHRAGGRVQAEGDIGDAQRGLHLGVALLDRADRLDGLQGVPPRLLLAGRDREGQAVHDDVADPHAPVTGEVLDQPGGHGQLPVRGPCLALLVDGERDHRGTVLGDQRHHRSDTRLRAISVLVVDRVHDHAAAEHLQPGPDHVRLGGVQRQREGGGRGEPAGQLGHVGRPGPAHVVHADVEQVRAVPGLLAGDLHAVVEAAGQQRLAERLGPVGVGPLPDRQECRVLAERDMLIEGGDSGLGSRPAPGQRPGPDPVHHGGQVIRGRPAAPADQSQPELRGE